MTVPRSLTDASVHRRRRTFRDDPEPALADLLGDSTLQALMRRDGIAPAQLETLIREIRSKLRLGRAPAWSSPEAFEASLFAECRAG